MNPEKIVKISFAILSLIVSLILAQVAELAWDFLRFPVQESWAVKPPQLVAILLGVATYFLFIRNDNAKVYATDVVVELSKVIWPVKKETLISTVIVIIMISIASGILTMFDVVWGTLTQRILSF